eukprot:scaffold16499_cov60-Attheya_sp.AAC.3
MRIGIGEEREGWSKSCWEQETADRPPLPYKSGGSGINVGTVGALSRGLQTRGQRGWEGAPVCTRVTLDFLLLVQKT